MSLEHAYIPHGAYWSTPFCRWQGSLAHENAIELAARTTRKALGDRGISPEAFDGLSLGITVPQRHSFYGAPWLAGMIGAPSLTGATVAQACATSARLMASAAVEVETGQRQCVLTVACDRVSNGPHIYYPNPQGIGGRGETEEPVWESFQHDPWARHAMIETAENVARQESISREEQDEVTFSRFQQYQEALARDRAFQRRYMVAAEVSEGRKGTRLVETDEGIHPTTVEGLAKLRPVLEDGTVTFGSQTHPADGNAGLVVCGREKAAELGRDAAITIRLLGFGTARVKKGYMPLAPVPAARAALEQAGVALGDCKVIKTHNPFAVNDIYFSRQTGIAPDALNPYGSPLIFGHPQGPTGLRATIELIEALVVAGGGYGLFTGCAAGDTAMSLVLRVD